MKKALLIIDMQNDFMPGGALAVPQADSIIPYINDLQKDFDLVVATQDWHPKNHISFYTEHANRKPFEEHILPDGIKQTLWPPHCIQEEFGAQFHPNLNTNKVNAIFRKGMQQNCDSYSAFYDNAKRYTTGLHGFLQEHEIDELFFTGVAGDICVLASVQDARELGYKCAILTQGVALLSKENFAKAIKSMPDLVLV